MCCETPGREDSGGDKASWDKHQVHNKLYLCWFAYGIGVSEVGEDSRSGHGKGQ